MGKSLDDSPFGSGCFNSLERSVGAECMLGNPGCWSVE